MYASSVTQRCSAPGPESIGVLNGSGPGVLAIFVVGRTGERVDGVSFPIFLRPDPLGKWLLYHVPPCPTDGSPFSIS